MHASIGERPEAGVLQGGLPHLEVEEQVGIKNQKSLIRRGQRGDVIPSRGQVQRAALPVLHRAHRDDPEEQQPLPLNK